MSAVQRGDAGICAIDAVMVAMARRHRPALEGLVEIARSPSVPALPYVTSIARSGTDIEKYRQGLKKAFSDRALAQTRPALILGGF